MVLTLWLSAGRVSGTAPVLLWVWEAGSCPWYSLLYTLAAAVTANRKANDYHV